MNTEVTFKLTKQLEDMKKGNFGPNSAFTRYGMAWRGLADGIVLLGRFFMSPRDPELTWLQGAEAVVLLSAVLKSFHSVL